ncbi:MAG: ACP S-malonyltransferase [Actinobacteria bacterium]|nr:ACP S-malonyltransferase [Actinomycetota bacterium]
MKAGLWPGQGIPARMVLEGLPAGHGLIQGAREILGYDLRRRVDIAGRRKGALLPTALAQPAILVAGLISWEESAPSTGCAFFAGHSVGEYAALVAGGALTVEDALRIVQVRADAMEAASRSAGTGMAAVLGLSLDRVAAIADEAGVAVANDNAPGQVVIAGGEAALTEAATLVRAARGRSILLETAGAFHTDVMASAEAPLKRALRDAHIQEPSTPVISNVTGRPYADVESIRDLLGRQLTSRVRFRESLEWMWGEGVREFEDFGPGQVAAGMAARTFKRLESSEVTVNA